MGLMKNAKISNTAPLLPMINLWGQTRARPARNDETKSWWIWVLPQAGLVHRAMLPLYRKYTMDVYFTFQRTQDTLAKNAYITVPWAGFQPQDALPVVERYADRWIFNSRTAKVCNFRKKQGFNHRMLHSHYFLGCRWNNGIWMSSFHRSIM